MTNTRLALYLSAALAVAILYAWLTYVIRWEASRVDTTARLILAGAEKMRPRLLAEEGINADA